MNIVFTVTDVSHAVHAGGEIERRSAIVEIRDDLLPEMVKHYLKAKAEDRPEQWCYLTMSVSIGDSK